MIIDGVEDAVTGMSREEPAQLWNNTVQKAAVADVGVIALHHCRKAQVGNKKPNTIDDVYGSQFLSAGFGSVICLWGEPGDPVLEFGHIKQPANPCGPRRMWVSERGTCVPYLEGDGLAGRIGPEGIAVEDAARLMGKSGPAGIEQARRKLRQLTREGVLKEEPGDPRAGARQ